MRRGRFDSLLRRTDNLKLRISVELSGRGIDHAMAGEGAMFNFYLRKGNVENYRDARNSDLRLRRLIDIELLSRGVYLKPENRYCLSLAHSDHDIGSTARIFGEALDVVTSNAAR